MASSSFISLVVLLQLLLVSASASSTTKYISAICEHVKDKTFCIQTLNAYHPAASATDEFQAAKAALKLGRSYAQKSGSFVKKAAIYEPKLKKTFKECQDAYSYVATSLKNVALELKEDPMTANYDAMVCTDSTRRIIDLVGKNRDRASKMAMTMVLKMEKLIAIAVGATEALGG